MDYEQQEFYNNSEAYLRAVYNNQKEYFDEYFSFVAGYFFPSDGCLLDLGCGVGQSVSAFRRAGYEVIGADGSARFIKEAKNNFPEAEFVAADASALPFPSDYFGAVAAYNTAEHFSDLEKNLREMIRVAKPGGLIIINSPNLLSPRYPIGSFLRSRGMTFEGKKNIWQLGLMFWRNIFWLAGKAAARRYSFSRRTPAFGDFFPDADATWYLNPIDLKKFFLSADCEIIAYQKLGASQKNKNFLFKFFAFLAPSCMGITRIVARKK